MAYEAREALERLKERIGSRTAAQWLEEARVARRGGTTFLTVPGAFQKSFFETRWAELLTEVFGGPVEVVAAAAPAAPAPRERAVPQLTGPAGEFAVRMVRAFATGGPAGGPLLLLYGDPRSGKSLLAEWACRLAGPGAFVLDLARLRRGQGRGLVPRKPLTVADGLELLAGRRAAQQGLCAVIDRVRDRGHRLLFTLEGHPATRADLLPALRSRLLGGLLVPVEAEDDVQRFARTGRRSGAEPPGPERVLGSMKDVAARLFGVERTLLDGATKRRTVVEARRAVMAAACRTGVDRATVARAFGLRSPRAVMEACRWAEREEGRDRCFASLLHEVARVRPAP